MSSSAATPPRMPESSWAKCLTCFMPGPLPKYGSCLGLLGMRASSVSNTLGSPRLPGDYRWSTWLDRCRLPVFHVLTQMMRKLGNPFRRQPLLPSWNQLEQRLGLQDPDPALAQWPA